MGHGLKVLVGWMWKEEFDREIIMWRKEQETGATLAVKMKYFC